MEPASSNEPIMKPSPGLAGWMPVWIRAISKPSEQTFIEISDHPAARSSTAFIWVFLAGTVSAIISGLLSAILMAAGVATTPVIPGLEQFTGPATADGGSIVTSLVTSLCASPVAGIISVIVFAIGVGILQWIARLLGGVGTFDQLAYALAAISVPITLVSALFTGLAAVPYLGICTGLVSLGVAVYGFVLEVMAVKGVNRFSWGKAIGTVLIPVAVVLVLCLCVIVVAGVALGPAISDLFNQINQGISP